MTFESLMLFNFVIWMCFLIFFCLKNERFSLISKLFLRSDFSNFLFFGFASVLVLWNVLHLSNADFGQYKYAIFAIFFSGIISCFARLKDFLSVRGLCVILLLMANSSLNSVLGDNFCMKKIHALLQYFIIMLAAYVAVCPYVFRDLIDKCAKNLVIKFIVSALCGCIASLFLVFIFMH